jgi:WD40 repeat protein/tetratricopeptide (TPR) repeat protein
MNAKQSPRLNPFPGLRPFRSDEHHLFFGREEQTAALLQLLRTNRFLAVVGTSGSGKSSLVRAGMIAELHGGTMTQAGSTWEVMILRPGGSPIENLARAFVEADLYDGEDPNTLPRLLATLNRSRFGLVEAMKQSDVFEPGTNLLVVVDQFEELFRFRQQGVDSEETAAAFVNLLLTASEQAECPIYVTITMRSDYLGDCSEIPGLAEAVNDGEYLIPRLLRDQKRGAIEKPIGVGGAKISPMLVQRLLNEVGDDPDQLPVLQHALMRMWDVWSKGSDLNRPIDVGDFEATGGLGAALSNHADEIYDSLPDDCHRSACEKIFKTLTVKGDDNRGIRRPTRLAQLRAIANADRDTVTTVLDAFRGAGVTFLMPCAEIKLDDRTVLDLSHESLMRGWQRLRGWVEEEAQSARVFRRLLDTARLWGDGKAGLFRDPDLQIALSWREQEAPNADWAEEYGGQFEKAIGFLEASNAEAEAERQAKEVARQKELEHAQELAESRKQRLLQQQRAASRLRKLIAGLAVVALIAVAACAVALASRNEASRLAKIAEQEADNARHNEEKAKQSQEQTKDALAKVESQKTEVEGSLSKAEAAERVARDAEEAGRKLLYTTDMRLAPFVWRDDRTTAEQLRVLLAKHIPDSKTAAEKPDLRGFEWHYYQHLLEQSATVFSGHSAVADGALTPDGQLVTVDEKGQVRRWDLSSQSEDAASRRDLPSGAGAKEHVLSPNGRLAALAEGNKVHVLDAATGTERYAIDSADGPVRYHRLVFSPDSDKLILVDDKVRWCKAVSGEVIATVNQGFGRIECLACSADGLTLAVGGLGNVGNHFSVFRLDATTKKVTTLANDIGPEGTLSAAALTPDGQRVAVGRKLGGMVAVFDTATGRSIAEHTSAHASSIRAMAFAGDGAKLATADSEGTIKIWADAQKLNSKSTALVTLKGHHGAIRSMSFSSDGRRLVSASADKTARVWNLETAGAAIRPLESASEVNSWLARFSPDGRLIAVAQGINGSLRLWDAVSGRLVRVLSTGDQSRIHSMAFSPTDRRLLAVGYGGQTDISHVSLWDIDAGTELARLPGATDLPNFRVDGSTGVVGALAFSPDGRYLVAGFGWRVMFTGESSPNPIKVWEVATRRLIRRLYGHSGYCVSLDFSKDGKLLASGSRDGTAIIWSTATWNKVHTLQNPDPASLFNQSAHSQVEGVAFSPDGKTLAMASWERNVHLWDVAAGELLATLKGHSNAVDAVAFSPDGRTLASGSWDHTVRLWNVETRRELMQLDAGNIELGNVQTVAFSPDGKQLLAGGSDRTAIWSAAPPIWNDPDLAAAELRLLLQSNADFQSRIRMLSENLRLHEALAKLDTKDVRVQAALAATQANWYVSREAWPEAVAAFDRLLAADPTKFDGWLRTPGLLRLGTALLHQDRPAAAAKLLHGGARRRTQDGLPDVVDQVGFGLMVDVATGKLLHSLRTAINERLAKEPRNPGLLELRAELAGQESESKAQVADYTAAIEALTQQKDEAAAADLKRLYERRGTAYVALKQWHQAVDDYARAVTDTATDEVLLSNQALAQAEVLLESKRWTVLKPAEAKSELGATLSILPDDSILASGANPLNDRYRVVMTVGADIDLAALRLEALTHNSLPQKGPGRHPTGNYAQDSWKVIATLPDQKEPITLKFDKVWEDQPFQWGIQPGGRLNIFGGGEGRDCTAIWATSKPVSLVAGAKLTFEFQFKSADGNSENLGHFRLSVSSDPAAIDLQRKYFSITKLTDPWQKLAAAYLLKGDQQAVDQLVERRPKLAGPIGDLFTQGNDEEKDWRRALALYNKAITEKTADGDLLSKRARAYEALKNWDAAAADWARAAAGNPDGAKLLGEFARRLAAGNQLALAKAPFAESQALYEKALKGDPGNDVVAAELAQLLLDKLGAEPAKEPDWVVLKPAQAKTESGAKLTLQEDGSILVEKVLSAEQPTVRWLSGPQPVRAVRIESSTNALTPTNGAPFFNEYQTIAASMARAGALRGQFVRLDLPGDNSRFPRSPADKEKKTINLAELQVFHGDQNIALRKKARQSSTYQESRTGPERAVDGNIVGNDSGNPYAHTITEDNPWWEVDLGSEQAIDRIVIWNRTEFGLHIRMNHFRVRVLDRARNVVFEQVIDKAPNPSTEIVPQRLLVDTKPEAAGENQPLIVRLPRWVRNDAPPRYRISVAPRFADLAIEDIITGADGEARLAAGYALNGQNEGALQHFGTALRQAEDYQARKPIVELAARFDEVLSALIQRHPEDVQLQLALARKLAERGKLYLAEKQPAKAQADLEKSREVYLRYGANHPESHWTVLAPTELKSKAGTTLTLQSDGSILASGVNPAQETYTVVAKPGLATITALRLETLPHPSLPRGGSGRDINGAFYLTEFTVSTARPGGPPAQDPLPLRIPRAVASFHRTDWGVHPIEHAFDGRLSTAWQTWPEVHRRQEAVFEVQPKPENMAASMLIIQLTSIGSAEFLGTLGCFRLSATSDTDALVRAEQRMYFKDSEVIDLYIALAKANAEQGHFNDTVASFNEALNQATDRADIAKIITEAAPREGILEKLAERAAGNAPFQAALARHFAEQGMAPLAEAARAKARALFEEKLAKEPENTALAADLADLLLSDSRDKWTVLKPSEMTSKGGATLTLLDDGSILTGGKNPDRDIYSLAARTDLKQINAIRLEALTDPSLPQGGPGRHPNGNFHLGELRVYSGGQRVASTNISVVYDETQNYRNVIAGRAHGTHGWSNYPRAGQPNTAIIATRLERAPDDDLKIELCFSPHPQYTQTGLGRFRLSISGDSAIFTREESRLAVMKLADPWQRLAAAYHVIGDPAARDKLLERHPAAAAGIGDLYAQAQDWERALAEYNKAITQETKDARLFAVRAEVLEKLEKWELAAADWGNADLHAVVKSERYGNPSFPYLERRTWIWSRLQQHEKIVLDCNELLKPERLGDNPYIFMKRGEAYDGLRQWQKARADYDRAITLSSPAERGSFHFFRARHFAVQGQWKQAAEDTQQAYQKPADFINSTWPRNEGWCLRDAVLFFAVAGDVDNYSKAAAECYRKQSVGTPNPDDSKWAVLTMLLVPEMVTNENRPRLLELAANADAYWQPRLTAAIQFRSGDHKKAAEFFDANGPGSQFLFLAAMIYHKLGNQDRAKQLLDEGNAWVQEQRDKDPAGIRQHVSLQESAFVVALQYEASELIAGPGMGANKLPERPVGEAQFQAALARHFATRGNAKAADAARAKARPLLARQLAAEPDNAAIASDLANLLWSALPRAEYYWIDDAAPPGANLQVGEMIAGAYKLGGSWEFVSQPDHPVFRGTKSTRRQAKGVSQHFFDGAAPGLKIGDGARLFAYVYLDPKDPPKAVMLQFKDGATGWDHRAFWGEDVMPWGTAGKEDHVSMGPLPRTGEWVRLEVEAAKVGLSAGAELNGWAFTQHGGTCYWDAAGITGPIQEPWQKLAAAYHRLGDQKALDALVKRHPEAAVGVGDTYAASQDWERAIAEYGKLLADRPADVALVTKLASAYQMAGRTREAVPYVGKASAANPQDTILSLEVAARQAWFGQDKELAATRQRVLAFAKGTSNQFTANQAAKACSLRASTDKAALEAALTLGRTGAQVEKNEWNLLALGMAEYRSGNDAAADGALVAAAQAAPNNPYVTGPSAFYRAMSLFRLGKPDEARRIAIAAAVKMKPLPRDDNNPLAGGADHNDLILWLAYKEARTLLKIELSPIELLEEARNDEVKTLGADNPATVATTLKLVDAYTAAGRTRETAPLLASASSAAPKDTILALRAAAMQAWFGQEKEYAATRKRLLAFAKDTTDPGTCDHVAKSCSIRPSTDRAELEAALALARRGVELRKSGQWSEWNLLTFGMAEYRNGNHAAAIEAMLAAVKAGPDIPVLLSMSGFYRAMSLFQQGKHDDARKLALETAAQMKSLPKDEQNPLTDGAYYDTQIMWLAYKEAKALIKFEPAPPPKAENDKKQSRPETRRGFVIAANADGLHCACEICARLQSGDQELTLEDQFLG